MHATNPQADHLYDAKAALRIALALEQRLAPTDLVPASVREVLDEHEWAEDVYEFINAVALDLYATKRTTLDGDTVIESVTVVTTTGGPHAQFTLTEFGTGEAEAWGWHRDGHRSVPVFAPALADLLFDLFTTAEVIR